MHVSLIPVAFCALLIGASAETYAACSGDCAEGSKLRTSDPASPARKSSQPLQGKEQTVVALGLGEGGVAGRTGDGAAALALRADNGRNARAEIRPARMERNALDPMVAVSKPPAWVLLLAGLAFAVIVVKKRGGG